MQGEGPLSGTDSVFVRTSGCNLRCWFCDTPYASFQPEGDTFTVQQVFESVVSYSTQHVVITGGEPLLFPDVEELSTRLSSAGHHITFETAGTIYRPVVCDLMAISPKLSSSQPRNLTTEWRERHEQTRYNPAAIAPLLEQYDCILKFVIDTPDDLVEVEDWLSALDVPRDQVWLMPQATSREDLRQRMPWLADAAADKGYQLSSRLHIQEFGNVRGK